jgi:hypothetical protein
MNDHPAEPFEQVVMVEPDHADIDEGHRVGNAGLFNALN